MSEKNGKMFECVICQHQVSKRKSYATPKGRACKIHQEAQEQNSSKLQSEMNRMTEDTSTARHQTQEKKFIKQTAKKVDIARRMICAMLHEKIISEDEVDMIIEKIFYLTPVEKMYFYEFIKRYGGYNLTAPQLKQVLEVIDWEEWRVLINDFKLQETKLTA